MNCQTLFSGKIKKKNLKISHVQNLLSSKLYIIKEELSLDSRAHLNGCLKAMGRERMGRKAGNRVLLNKTLDLYLSSYQIYTKSMVWFRKY